MLDQKGPGIFRGLCFFIRAFLFHGIYFYEESSHKKTALP